MRWNPEINGKDYVWKLPCTLRVFPNEPVQVEL